MYKIIFLINVNRKLTTKQDRDVGGPEEVTVGP